MADILRPATPPGRRPRIFEFAISRLRRSWVLRGCAALAFLEYGALVIVAVFGGRLRLDSLKGGGYFSLAGWLALCSLGSWFFLFAWFPFLRSLHAEAPGDGSALAIGRVLESIAIACVVAVHVMLAVVLAAAM